MSESDVDRQPIVFLSHSSLDKPAVRKLTEDLEKQGVVVWLDAGEIKVGDRFIKRIQDGIVKSDFLAIWLTKHSMASSWVQDEWFAKFQASSTISEVAVLPLLAEDCDIPLFLKNLNYADFRFDYDAGFSSLLSKLGIEKRREIASNAVGRLLKTYLKDLEKEKVCIPFREDIEFIKQLKIIPRSGKIVRLENYEPRVQIRSIYDHIMSLAHSADTLLPVINHGIKGHDFSSLALCIAYHELNEVILGDIPKLTNLDHHKMETARVKSYRRLKDQEGTLEFVTNRFVRLYLDDRNQTFMDDYLEICEDGESEVWQFFHVLDKLDPIIAVWRYLHHFRGKLDNGAEIFTEKLIDFFKNKKVRRTMSAYSRDNRISELAHYLLDVENALKYYDNKKELDYLPQTVGLHKSVVGALIQGRYFHFADAAKPAWGSL